MQPCLVVYDDDKNAFWAIGIKSKAVTQSIVKYFKDLLDQSGYEGEKITMKSDQEPSILALKRAVAAARSGQTVPIESPVRSSKSNGNRKVPSAYGRDRSGRSSTSRKKSSRRGSRSTESCTHGLSHSAPTL